MNKKYKLAFFILLTLGALFLGFLILHGSNFAVLNPKGLIAQKERSLFVIATLLMLLIVIPVIIITFFIVWRYRESNTTAKYRPDWDYSLLAESLWWGIPGAIVIALSVLTWTSSHELDPFKPLDSKTKPIRIQVVALQWKWLFIYPEHNIATVNFVQFPERTPLNFEITADAPMNSFWIPQLGGQIYAMPGMKTKLHLIANEVGSFDGSSANFSGQGFAGMKFIAKSCTPAEFEQWVKSVKKSPNALSSAEYTKLAAPSENAPVATYSSPEENLYDRIVMKYMMPIP
jgi:cytochrome o ubiquinol oxidase subunit II